MKIFLGTWAGLTLAFIIMSAEADVSDISKVAFSALFGFLVATVAWSVFS